MNYLVTDITSLSMYRKAYMAAMVSCIVLLSVYWGETWYGMVSAVSGIMCVILVAEKRLSNFYWGLVNCALYGFISYQNNFFGDMSLNWFIYLPFQFIGFYMWSKNMDESSDVTSKSLSWYHTSMLAILTSSLVAVGAYILAHVGGNHPMLDSFNVVLSLVATVLMAKRYAEQWLCWILVNVSGIAMWVSATIHNSGEGVATLIMWSAFLINSLYGYYKWKTTSVVTA